jgi:predicted transcriptional regulator
VYRIKNLLAGLKPRRSRLDLHLEVLEAIKNGKEKPTRIMYEANLSWTSLKDILSSLVSQDLVEEVDVTESRDKRTNKIYRVTEKGNHLIKYFHHAEQLLELE